MNSLGIQVIEKEIIHLQMSLNGLVRAGFGETGMANQKRVDINDLRMAISILKDFKPTKGEIKLEDTKF